jgi:hypothetical protein
MKRGILMHDWQQKSGRQPKAAAISPKGDSVSAAPVVERREELLSYPVPILLTKQSKPPYTMGMDIPNEYR